jgi:2'-5' RNA ligase
MSKSIRAFIALELPENIIAVINNIQKDMKSFGFNVKWVQPENIHLTLKFLGNISPTDVTQIGSVIGEVAKPYAPIPMTAKAVGVFPGMTRPRVIWIGVGGQVAMILGLQKILDEKLNALGFPMEKRPFKGHLTLGRVKGNISAQQLSGALQQYNEFESDIFLSETVVLFKSVLDPKGSIYTKLLNVSL